MRSRSTRTSEFSKETFGLVPTDNDTAEERRKIRTLIRESQRWLHDFTTGGEPRWLVITGWSGVGKTHVATAIAEMLKHRARTIYEAHYRRDTHPEDSWLYRQEGPIYCKWARLIDLSREGDYSPFRRACEDFLKIIDDIGAEGLQQDGKPFQHVINQLGKLHDQRMGKWTIITTNYSHADMAAKFDTRISSRWLRGENAVVDLSNVRDFNIRRRTS